MLIESIELTMSHVGLGHLNEYAMLVLFGNAHSHHLTLNTGILPNQIRDNQGLVLYPAYFMTHLTVPPNFNLADYKLWDKVSVGVDVTRFGETMLESCYLLGRDGEVLPEISQWSKEAYPYMKANSLIIVDVSEKNGEARKVSVPKAECFASLPKLKKAPEAILRSRNIRNNGFGIKSGNITMQEPLIYHVAKEQDAAAGHAMMFANFSKIMNWAEDVILSKRFRPGFSGNVLQFLSLLERETFFYGNCFAGETLEIYLNGAITECAPNYHGDSLQTISVALLTYQVEIYTQRNQNLLIIASVKKLLALPITLQDFIPDVQRIIKNLKYI